MNKSEVKITMKTTYKDNILEEVIDENPHRKIKAILLFIDNCLDHGHIKPEQLFEHLKKSKRLNFTHLIRYAFTRED